MRSPWFVERPTLGPREPADHPGYAASASVAHRGKTASSCACAAAARAVENRGMTATATATRYVYDFAEGSRDMRVLLGGKGANIAEMTRVLGPDLVPAGFTITTEACVAFMHAGRSEPAGLAEQVAEGVARLEERTGRALGDPDDPLLVSVRSGARDSMPGMLETILDLGLNDESVQGLAARTGDERFAWDSYRRFVQMFGNVVRGIPGERYEEILPPPGSAPACARTGSWAWPTLREITRRFRALYEVHTGEPFPQDPQEQLRLAVRAVFDSWLGDRAVSYRRINHIPDDWGTAVNVQQMVFGNLGAGSATGVAFSRDEMTGAPEPSGDFLLDAQGEDVVSGVRTPRPLHELAERAAGGPRRAAARSCARSRRTTATCRTSSSPSSATASTCCRRAAPSARPRPRSASPSTRSTRACSRASARSPRSTPARSTRCCTRRSTRTRASRCSRAASPRRRARPRARSSSPPKRRSPRPRRAATSSSRARSPRPTTSPASTPRAGSSPPRAGRRHTRRSSPAAWAAPRWSAPASSRSTCARARVRVGDVVIAAGRADRHRRRAPAWSRSTTCRWWSPRAASASSACCAGPTTSAGSACAPTPTRRPTRCKALEHGAEGIGLCRTEHMFMAADRQPKMRAMIMARTEPERRAALAELLPLQQQDFEGLFAAMPGRPITIRLLDPPLHEFLPDRVELAQRVQRARDERAPELAALEQELELVLRLGEVNPMLGTRGCRLGHGPPRDLRDAGRGDHARGARRGARRRSWRS